MAEAIVLSAVEKLENLLVIKEGVSKHRKTAKEKEELVVVVVEGLRDDLRGMLSLFTNNSTKESGDYISRVTEIAHDVDVAIDNYILQLQDTQPKSAFFKFFKPSSGQVMNTFHGMRICLQVLWSEFSRSEEAGPTSRRIPPAVEVEVGVVEGMKEDVELVLRKAIFLEESAQGLATSCIVGMGGVGKTTLAQMLYTHERVASEFEIRAWVYVSTEFTSKQVLKELILQFGVNYDEVDAHEPSRLRDIVYQHLHTRRYFIILDHVWRDQDLDFVFTAFPHNEKASRLLVTSRIRDIIGHAQYIHERRTLDHIQSWRLFLKTVFGEYNKCPNHLVEIGRKIVTRCDGLPLAIMEAGGKLSVKEQSESEWASFLESMDLSSTSEILELSYHKMRSPIMKSCFLHVGSFMEGTTIRVQKLVQLWTAGGILDVSRGKEKSKTDEEIGIFFIAELINECIFEVKGRSKTDYRVKYCYINRNLHRLAVAKATEEIRFEVRKSDDLTSKKSRHCVICCSRDKFNYHRDHDEHLISLVFRGGGSLDNELSWLNSLKLLKILDFEGFGLKTLPKNIGKLISLEYLGLRNNFIKQLPQSLAKLERLEVFDIALNFEVEVPRHIWKIRSLRHLYMSDIICMEPLQIDDLKNLQTLTYISADNLTYELLRFEKMDNLRKLGIQEVDRITHVSKILASLAMVKNLDCLILKGSRFRRMSSLDELCSLNRLTQLKLDGLLTKLPSATDFPPDIRYMSLVNTSLDEDPMPVLEKLSKLQILNLRNAFMGEEMMVSHLGFAELEGLCMGELWRLRNLQVGEGAMPKLKRLEINNCPYLETLPKEMANLKELKMVTTKGIARKILETGACGSISKRGHVDIQP